MIVDRKTGQPGNRLPDPPMRGPIGKFIYDHFTPLVLMAFEELGFCKRGEGGPFVSDGKLLWPNGALPFNTSGGNLSEGYIHGMQNTIEAVRQLRGVAINQVKDAEIAFIASGNAVPNTAMIVHR